MQKKAVIYKIENTVDDKVYVGSTVDMKNRWKCHRYQLRVGTHHSPHLQFAWNKYGEDSFRHTILAECPERERDALEQSWIDSLRSSVSACGYNQCPVVGSRSGLPHSEETKAKMSRAHKGRVRSAIHCQRIGDAQRGRKLSPEHIAKMSAALKGRKHSPESIRKSVEARRGFRHSAETRARFSEIAKLRPPPSVETRKKLSIAGRGRKWSDAQRAKMAARPPCSRTKESRENQSKARGGRPFIVTAPDGSKHHFATLSEAKSLGLDSSNVHKCLIGQAKQTRGHYCEYDAP